MTGDNVELSLMQRAGSDMPPYQRLLGDAMRGNNELFGRADTIDAQWRIVEPILKNPPAVQEYEPGTLGTGGGERAHRRRWPVAESRCPRQNLSAVHAPFAPLARRAAKELTPPVSNGPAWFPFRPSSTSRRTIKPAHGLAKLRAPHELPRVDAGTVAAMSRPLRSRSSSAKPIIREFGHDCGLVCKSRSASSSSPSCGCACARIISVAAVEREISGMAVDQQTTCFGRVAAKRQNGLDVPFLRQQNVRARLDRIMKAQGRAKVRVITPGTLRDPAIPGRGSTEHG